MGNSAKLNDAIMEGWTKCLVGEYGDGTFSSAIDGMTDCNRFVDYVCQKMGYVKFVPDGQRAPMLANAMFDFMNESEDWKELSATGAQWYANLGGVVVAAYKNQDGHGHVCMVRLGEFATSGKWKSDTVPKVANVSHPSLCRIDRGANYAFGDPPKYFGLKETF